MSSIDGRIESSWSECAALLKSESLKYAGALGMGRLT